LLIPYSLAHGLVSSSSAAFQSVAG